MILDVERYSDWKARVFKVVAKMMGLKAKHVLFVDIDPGGDVEYTPPPCKTCEETGRLMTVTTYTIIDCPRCYGRG